VQLEDAVMRSLHIVVEDLTLMSGEAVIGARRHRVPNQLVRTLENSRHGVIHRGLQPKGREQTQDVFASGRSTGRGGDIGFLLRKHWKGDEKDKKKQLLHKESLRHRLWRSGRLCS